MRKKFKKKKKKKKKGKKLIEILQEKEVLAAKAEINN
jgi:hypothetical protein